MKVYSKVALKDAPKVERSADEKVWWKAASTVEKMVYSKAALKVAKRADG